jgi:imidazolonepropionase-like amidohydrolase
VIRSATTYAAELVRASGELGIIAPGAQGDVIMVDGDPLKDINVLAQPDKYLKLVMRGGEIVVNRL